ncbi:Ig-like domain-containing protein [Paraliobacillus sediminis]|uniref:Ig-like domain-containing protein n=1 Tax=Paraliobacillus sediminis TaxID=1885916 RepID=UPI000E3C9F64|nr:Ig-like domain-containing protein [Paraliobacillus sediminis]
MAATYKSNKKLFWIVTLAIVFLSIGIFGNHVFSSSELSVKVNYKDDTWDTSKAYPFEKNWLTTEEQVTFTIDLSTYYNQLEEEQVVTDPDQPFKLSATYSGNEIELDKVESLLSEEGDFQGIYQVSYQLPPEEDGQLDIEMTVLEADNWGITTQQNPITFAIVKDTKSPDVTVDVDGVEPGDIYYPKAVGQPTYPTLDIKVEDLNLLKDTLVMTVNGEAVDPGWEIDGTTAKSSYKVENDGDYIIDVIAQDIASNETSKKVAFAVHNEEPELTVSAGGTKIENNAYVTEESIQFVINNGVSIGDAAIEVTKDGNPHEDIEAITIEGKTATVTDDFAEEGTYQVTGFVKDANDGKSYDLESFTFIVDREAPSISILDKSGNELGANYGEVIGDVTIQVNDTNLNKDETTVTITRQKEDGSEDVDIDFEFDKTTATAVYDFQEQGLYTINVLTTDLAGRTSEVTQEVILDLKDPEVQLKDVTNDQDLNSFYKEEVEVEFILSDLTLDLENSKFEVNKKNQTSGEMEAYLTKDDLNNGDFLSSLTHTFGEGVFEINIETVDLLGNKKTQSESLVIDLYDPIIEIDSSVEDGDHLTRTAITDQGVNKLFPITIEELNLHSQSVKVKRTNAAGEEVVLEDVEVGKWEQSEENESIQQFVFKEGVFDEDGNYELVVEAKDSSNRTSSKEFTFTVDNIKPVIELSELAAYENESVIANIAVTENNYATNNVSIEILKQDNDGSFAVYENDSFETWENKAIVSDSDLLFDEDGTYKIKVRATDKAGNKADEIVKTFTVDTKAPVLVIDGVKDHEHYNKDIKVDFSANDENIDLENTIIQIEKWNDSANDYQKVEIDEELSVISGLVSLSHKFTDEGMYRLRLAVTDKAENKAEEEIVHFTIDKTTPITAITNITDQKFYSSNQAVTFSVVEKNFLSNNVSFTVMRNGTDYTDQVNKMVGEKWMNKSKEAAITYDFEEDGFYTVSLRAIDAAGNQVDEITKSFTIDAAYPNIVIEGVEQNKHYDQDKEVEIKIQDDSFETNKVEVTRDGMAYNVGDFDITKVFFGDSTAKITHTFKEEGEYTISVESIDKSGNRSTKEITFTIDKTKPTIELGKDIAPFITSKAINEQGVTKLIPITVAELNLKDKSIEITRTGVDGKEETFKKSDIGNWEKVNETAYRFMLKDSFFAVDGDYTITINVEDKAGQSVKDSLQFTVDNSKPTIKLSKIDKFNEKAVTQTIQVDEYNYRSNDVTINMYKENSNGKFVTYNHSALSNWENNKESSSLDFKFENDGKYKVEVKAEDASGNKATTQSNTFTVDTITPELSLSGVREGVHYNTNKKVTVAVTDQNINPSNTKLSVTRLNHSSGKMRPYDTATKLNFNQTSASWAYTFSTDQEGTYEVKISATDKAGNKADAKKVKFTIDKTAPMLFANNVKDNAFYSISKRVGFLIDETNYQENSAKFTVQKDGKDITPTVEGSKGSDWKYASKISSLNYNFNQEGSYTINMSARDAAGNNAKSVQKTFAIDTIKPTIDIEGVSDNEYYNVDKPVSVSIKDVNLDANTIRVTKDGAAYNVGGFSITDNGYQQSIASLSHRFSQEGEYEIFVDATDKAGNQYSKQVAFTIDKTAPELTPKMSGDNTVIKDGSYINKVFTPIFSLDNPEEDTIESVRLNGGSNLAGNVPVASKEMFYEYQVLASDKAGNTTTLNISFTLDTTMPRLTITGILEGYFNENMAPRVIYSDKHLDEERTSVTLNGEPFENGALLDREQDYILKAAITDLADNSSERTIVFSIDKTAPIIQFKEAISGQYLNETIIPELFIEDMSAYDIITLTLNGNPYNLGDPIEDEGKHVLYFEVKDKAGNIQQLTVEFIIDKTNPEVLFEGAEADEEYYDPIELSIQLEDSTDTIKTVLINGEEFVGEVTEEDGNLSVKVNLSEIDAYEVEVIAYDQAGNEVNPTLSFEIVDKDILTKVYENKPLFAGTIIGLLALIGGGGTLLIRKRRISLIDKPEVE